MTNRQIKILATAIVALIVILLSITFIDGADATSSKKTDEHKVTICHRTNSVTNPYVTITVDRSAADDGTDKSDHAHHNGPVFDFSADPGVAYPPPHNGDQWGDIIPPHGSFPGQNWTDDGQAIFKSDCARPASATTTVKPTTTTAAPTTTTMARRPTTTAHTCGQGKVCPSTVTTAPSGRTDSHKPTPSVSGPSEGELARTGFPYGGVALLAGLLILMGLFTVWYSKRTRVDV